MMYPYLSHHHNYSLLVPSSLCSHCHASGKLIALLMEIAVVKVSLEGLSENDPDVVTAMNDHISPCRSEGRWREADEHQMKNSRARSKTLDAGHHNTLAAMGILAQSHPKSFNIVLYNFANIHHDFLMHSVIFLLQLIWNQLPQLMLLGQWHTTD
jgi:hypothetical protein